VASPAGIALGTTGVSVATAADLVGPVSASGFREESSQGASQDLTVRMNRIGKAIKMSSRQTGNFRLNIQPPPLRHLDKNIEMGKSQNIFDLCGLKVNLRFFVRRLKKAPSAWLGAATLWSQVYLLLEQQRNPVS
jgi:hypothetical protein